jgi:hypothetical protein
VNPVLTACRLQLVAPLRALARPAALLAVGFAVSAPATAIFRHNGSIAIGGGLFTVHITVLLTAAQLVDRTLPFALSLGLTRRAYYAGTCLFLAGESLGYGLLLALGRVLERATGHWGGLMAFFDLPFLHHDGLAGMAETTLTQAALIALAAAVGLGWGLVSLRWGGTGVAVLLAALLVLPGVLSWWVGGAGRIADWLSRQPQLVAEAGLPAGVALVLAGLAFVGVRRVTV